MQYFCTYVPWPLEGDNVQFFASVAVNCLTIIDYVHVTSKHFEEAVV